MNDLTPTQLRLLEVLEEAITLDREDQDLVTKQALQMRTSELYVMRRKFTAMTVQRDEWKERAARYRKQFLEKK